MAVLNWGKPTIEVTPYIDGVLPESPVWTKLPTPVEGTTTLETEEGDKTEAIEEGGGVVDTYRKKSKYTLSVELFEKKGEEKPIEDEDGIVTTNYAVRLTPEDKTTNGYLLKKTTVGFSQTYNAADGGRWKYTFDALVPDDASAILQKYIAGAGE